MLSNQFALFASIVSWSLAQTYPGSENGNCFSQRLDFSDSNRIQRLQGSTDRSKADPTLYDFTLDVGSVEFASSSAVFTLQKGANHLADSATMSSTRYIQYGRITAQYKPSGVPGVVTSFMTISDREGVADSEKVHDEIDIEFTGNIPSIPQTNVFTYQTKHLERGSHGGNISSTIDPNVAHQFTIDWRSDRLDWLVDGQIVKTISKSTSRANLSDSLPEGTPWFPTEPSRISFGMWDGSDQAGWTGGPVDWNKTPKATVQFDYFDIQCYDSNNNPVPKWPLDSPDPVKVPHGHTNSSQHNALPSSSYPNSAPTVFAIFLLATLTFMLF